MTKTESAPRNHIDGGTYRVLAFAETRNGWAVAVTEWTTYRGEIVFQIHRVSDTDRMMAQGTFKAEAEARAAANLLWKRDR